MSLDRIQSRFGSLLILDLSRTCNVCLSVPTVQRISQKKYYEVIFILPSDSWGFEEEWASLGVGGCLALLHQGRHHGPQVQIHHQRECPSRAIENREKASRPNQTPKLSLYYGQSWGSKLFEKSVKSQISTILSSFHCLKSANFLGVLLPVRKSQIRIFSWLLIVSQIVN